MMRLKINPNYTIPKRKVLHFGYDSEMYSELFPDITHLGTITPTGNENEYIFRIDEIERREWNQTGNIRILDFERKNSDLYTRAIKYDLKIDDYEFTIHR